MNKENFKVIEILNHSTGTYNLDVNPKEYEGDWHSKVGKRLADKGFNVELWRPDYSLDENYSREEENYVFKVFTAAVFNILRWKIELSFSIFKELLERRKEDLVLEVHGPYTYQSLFTMAIFGSYFPIIVQSHGGAPSKHRYVVSNHKLKFLFLLKWQFEKYAFSKTEHVFCLNDTCDEEEMLSEVTKTSFSPMGVDFKKFRSIENPKFGSEDKTTLIYLGRLEERKGIKLLLNAFEELSRNYDNIELLIAGDGSLREEVEKFIRSNEDLDIEYLGYLVYEELEEFYSSGDLFVFSSTSEAYGITPVESLACETPVAGTDTGAVSDIIKTFGAGVMVEPGDQESLKSGIEDALNSEFSIEREEGRKKFGWEGIIEKRVNKIREFKAEKLNSSILGDLI